MHLSDQQLMEPDVADDLHLTECQSCRLRASHLATCRQALKQLPASELPADGWEKLAALQQARSNEHKLAQTSKRVRRWQLNSVALAASLLLLVLLLPQSQLVEHTLASQAEQLALLIEQNNALQQQLLRVVSDGADEPRDINPLRWQLSALDRSIQGAYVRQTSIAEKTALWSERHSVLEHWLSNQTMAKAIRI